MCRGPNGAQPACEAYAPARDRAPGRPRVRSDRALPPHAGGADPSRPHRARRRLAAPPGGLEARGGKERAQPGRSEGRLRGLPQRRGPVARHATNPRFSFTFRQSESTRGTPRVKPASLLGNRTGRSRAGRAGPTAPRGAGPARATRRARALAGLSAGCLPVGCRLPLQRCVRRSGFFDGRRRPAIGRCESPAVRRSLRRPRRVERHCRVSEGPVPPRAGLHGAAGGSSTTRTPFGGSKRKVSAGGPWFARTSRNSMRVTLPTRSNTAVSRTSPVARSTAISSFS